MKWMIRVGTVAVLSLGLAPGVRADTQTVIDTHILPGYASLAAQTRVLAETASADCTPDAVRPAFHQAFDAWISISHIQFGPIEDLGLTISMSFWPDPKDRVGRALGRLTSVQDPVATDPEAFLDVSAAAQGFTALERLLYEPQPDAAYACSLTRAISQTIAAHANRLNAAWPAFADVMLTAGEAGNARFQSEEEVTRLLYTALSTGLEFLDDARLGRPLGTFDRPRPRRAEAHRSERAQRHIVLSLESLRALADAFYAGDTPNTDHWFSEALERAKSLDDPALQGVSDPIRRIRVEAIQGIVEDIRTSINNEIGVPLDIRAGFNALDGD